MSPKIALALFLLPACSSSSDSDSEPDTHSETDSGSDTQTQPAAIQLSSPDFENENEIPLTHACTTKGGDNTSPEISIASIPLETGSLALIMDDEDSPCGTGASACRHWALFGLPADTNSLPQNPNIDDFAGATQGLNYTGSTGYVGPCPPNQHTYKFTVFALDSTAPAVANESVYTRSTFEEAYREYILSMATLEGWFNPTP